MMKKPDRFERAVQRYGERSMDDYNTCVLTDREVVKLLRKEHAWMRGLLESEPELPGSMPDHVWAAARHDREMMEELLRSVRICSLVFWLAQLDQRRK